MKTTQFREIFPIVDFSDKYTFDQCLTVRDHYPSYLQYLDQEQIEQLNFDIEKADSKIIRLRRIVLSHFSLDNRLHALTKS